MPQFITYKNKRYEVTDNHPFIGCLVISRDETIIVEPGTLPFLEILISSGYKMLEEIPIFTEHTLSSIMINTERLVRDKVNRREFNRIRLSKEDFKDIYGNRNNDTRIGCINPLM